MSQTLEAPNYRRLNLLEELELDADAAAGDVSITVRNNNNVASTHPIVLGRLGGENTEQRTVSGTTGATAIAIDALKFDHPRFDKIYRVYGTKIRFYRAANVDGSRPADDDFDLLTTVDIDFDQMQTSYTDNTGGEDYWYTFTYYNSTAGSETAFAITPMRGLGSSNTPYTSVEAIRGESGLKSRWVTDADLDKKRLEAESKINSMLVGVYEVPFTEAVPEIIQAIATQLAAGYALMTNYGIMSAFNTANGKAKVDAAMAELTKLANREYRIVDVAGADISLDASSGFSAWPNADTAEAEASQGGGERMFRVSDIQGYESRQY